MMDADEPHLLEDVLNPQYGSLATIAPCDSTKVTATTTASPSQESPQMMRAETWTPKAAPTVAKTARPKSSSGLKPTEKEIVFNCPAPQVAFDQAPKNWRTGPLEAPSLYIGPRALSIEQQKVEYLKLLHSQLEAGLQALKEQLDFYQAALHEHCERQKRHYSKQVDKEVVYLTGKIARDYEAQVMKLRHDADEQRALKEKEAHESTCAYEQKWAEDILRQKQHALLGQHMQKHKLMHLAVAQAQAAQITRSRSMTKLGQPTRPPVRALSPNPCGAGLQKALTPRPLLVPRTVRPQVVGSPCKSPSRPISALAVPSPMMRPGGSATGAGAGPQWQNAGSRPSPSTLAPPRPVRGRSASPCRLKPAQLTPVQLGSPSNRQRPMIQSPAVHAMPVQKSLSASSKVSSYRESPESRPTLIPEYMMTPQSPVPKQCPFPPVTPQRGMPNVAVPGTGISKPTTPAVATSTPTVAILPA